MTDLTEQWKKGELPSGYYYVKNEFGNIFPSDYSEDYDYISDTVIKDFFTEVSEIKEVVEPVPSYEEFQNLKEYEQTILSYNMKPIDYEIACETVNKLLDERKALKEENTKLKELLKECRTYISEWDTPMDILARIDEVLGEDK